MAENRQSGSDRTQHSDMSEDKHPLGRQDQIREEQIERQRQDQRREQDQQGQQDRRSDKSDMERDEQR